MAASVRGYTMRYLPKMSLNISTNVAMRKVFRTLFGSTRSYGTNTKENDPEQMFIRSDVQDILKKVTGFHLDKIFREKMTKTQLPKYRLITDKQLHDLQEDAIERGEERLQMPPFMKPRGEEFSTLSEDPEIEGHDDHNMVFTDITYGLPDKSRVIVVRETDGTLRTASSAERDRMLQVYFPKDGRMHHVPHMFEEEQLERLLQQDTKHEYILDRACNQYEPDDPEYIRVSHRIYENINSRGEFDLLRSTRHFGPMAFYLVLYHKVEHLLVDMLQRDLLGDAADMVALYHLVHPECESAKIATRDAVTKPQELVLLFAKHSTSHGGSIELALQTYTEAQQAVHR